MYSYRYEAKVAGATKTPLVEVIEEPTNEEKIKAQQESLDGQRGGALMVIANTVLKKKLGSDHFLVAATMHQILKITFWAFAFRAGIAVILLSLTYLGSRRISESGAFWGLIAGAVMFTAWTLLGNPWGFHVAIPTTATVFLATLMASKFIKRKHGLPADIAEALHPRRKGV